MNRTRLVVLCATAVTQHICQLLCKQQNVVGINRQIASYKPTCMWIAKILCAVVTWVLQLASVSGTIVPIAICYTVVHAPANNNSAMICLD